MNFTIIHTVTIHELNLSSLFKIMILILNHFTSAKYYCGTNLSSAFPNTDDVIFMICFDICTLIISEQSCNKEQCHKLLIHIECVSGICNEYNLIQFNFLRTFIYYFIVCLYNFFLFYVMVLCYDFNMNVH